MSNKVWPLTLFLLSSALPAAAEQLYPPSFYSATGQFTQLRPAQPAPTTPIQALDGTTINLSQFKGKVIVLNFWASWCAACVYELPSLDRLAAQVDAGQVAVIAISIDRGGAAKVKPFIASHRLTHLHVYLDTAERLGSLKVAETSGGTLPLPALPVTYIIGRRGLVDGYIPGATQWDTPEARSFLGYFTKIIP